MTQILDSQVVYTYKGKNEGGLVTFNIDYPSYNESFFTIIATSQIRMVFRQ